MLHIFVLFLISKFFPFLHFSFLLFLMTFIYDQTFIIVISIIRKERNKFSYPSTQDLYIIHTCERVSWDSLDLADYLSNEIKSHDVVNVKIVASTRIWPKSSTFFDWLLSMMCYTSWNEIERCALYRVKSNYPSLCD